MGLTYPARSRKVGGKEVMMEDELLEMLKDALGETRARPIWDAILAREAAHNEMYEGAIRGWRNAVKRRHDIALRLITEWRETATRKEEAYKLNVGKSAADLGRIERLRMCAREIDEGIVKMGDGTR